MYTKPVGETIKQNNIKYHCQTDDRQIYITLKPIYKWDDISSSIEAFIADINIWMNTNMLKLNKAKIELIDFSSKQHVKKTENLRAKLGFSCINSFMSVRNLGLLLDAILD